MSGTRTKVVEVVRSPWTPDLFRRYSHQYFLTNGISTVGETGERAVISVIYDH